MDVVGLGNLGPEGLLVLATDIAHHVEAPFLRFLTVLEAEGLEWNFHLRFPSTLSAAAADGPGDVPVQVDCGRVSQRSC